MPMTLITPQLFSSAAASATLLPQPAARGFENRANIYMHAVPFPTASHYRFEHYQLQDAAAQSFVTARRASTATRPRHFQDLH